jgi:hypothetical protein
MLDMLHAVGIGWLDRWILIDFEWSWCSSIRGGLILFWAGCLFCLGASILLLLAVLLAKSGLKGGLLD